MKKNWIWGVLSGLMVVFGLVACDGAQEPATGAEAQEGLDETMLSSVEASLEADMVEISTHFTFGKGLKEAASELKQFIKTQVPCSTVTHADATVMIDFGDLSDNCTYNGKTYAGIVTITVVHTEDNLTVVTHEWTNLTNGKSSVSGTATVTWDKVNKTRQVQHLLTWNRNGKEMVTEGDRTQTLLDETLGIGGGVVINGTRTRTGAAGVWTLDIENIEIRPQDPVPQAGTYTVTLPNGKTMQYTFERIDDTTIQCTVTGPKKSKVFQVKSSGQVEQV